MSSGRQGNAPSAIRAFLHSEAASGIILVGCATLALIVANSSLGDAYHRLWQTPVALSPGPRTLSLHGWINDGLMAVFFLLVGLEIKREVLTGELASVRQAALPIAGAVGGMVVPAVIYTLTIGGGAAAHGWAIPMATDIAFALGVLALVAPGAPPGLRVFLAALAIVDDMGAVLVIALFYTGTLAWAALAGAAVVVSLLAAINALGVRRLAPYLLLGLPLWFFVYESGVHATIAGVLLALCMPMGGRRPSATDTATSTTPSRDGAVTPVRRLEHTLHRISSFLVMPLFALSNAGIALGASASTTVTLAVFLGLFVGKPLGITAAAWTAVRLGWGRLPTGVTWRMLHGCAWLGGIGFTMSLFIATLAFDSATLVDAAKAGIFSGSLCAGIVGAWLLRSRGAVAQG